MMFRFLFPAVAAFFIVTGCATMSGQGQTIKVIVKADDTLNSIAAAYDTDWHVIVAMNRAKLSEGLREGQELIIKPGPAAKIKEHQDDQQLAEEDDTADEDLSFLPIRKKGLLDGPRSTEPPQLVFPVEGGISSKFGKRRRRLHKGIDIAANVGTPIVAAAEGEVIFSGRQRGYGSTVVIDHGQFMTLYAHASKLIARTGDKVRQGDFIAKVGRTGNARGAHLHFELRNTDNKPIDPLPYLKHSRLAKAQAPAATRLVAQSNDASRHKSAKKVVTKHAKVRKAKKGLLYAKD